MAYYSDIDISLKKNRTGDITKDEDLEAVKNSIINICETIQGHRVMLPEFANNAYNILFDPVDKENANSLGSIIGESIEKGDRRVTLENINVNADHYNQEYQFTISFSIKNVTIDSEISSIFITLRRIT